MRILYNFLFNRANFLKRFFFVISFLLVCCNSYAQVTVGFSTPTNAGLEASGALPDLLVTGDVLLPTTVEIEIGGTASAGDDYMPSINSLVVNVPIGNYPPNTVLPLGLSIVDDFIAEADETIQLKISAVTGDASLGGTIEATIYTITNDDVVGVNVTPVVGTTTEAGAGTLAGNAEFVFTLTSEPTANVRININDYEVTENTGPANIIITPLNWNTGVTLIIQGVDDAIYDGDHVDIINTGNVVSIDTFYNLLVDLDVPQLTVTNIDNEVTSATISATDPIASEGLMVDQGLFIIDLGITNNTDENIVVNYAISGSATSIIDYEALQEAIIPPNFSTVGIPVNVIDDNLVEGEEVLTLSLLPGTGYDIDPIIANQSADVTIADNDVGNVTIVAVDAAAAEAGLDTGEFLVDLGGINGTQSPIEITFEYGNATNADEGVDFVAIPPSLEIPIGQQTASIILTPIDDSLIENIETVRLRVGNTSNPVVFPKAPIGVGIDGDDVFITSDDTNSISISNATQNEGNTGTSNFEFVVSVDGSVNASGDISFTIATADGTATSLEDYTAISGAGTILSGTSSTTIIVEVAGDADVESNETFTVNISDPTNATITDGEGLGTITNDDNSSSIVSINDPASILEGNSGMTSLDFTVTIDQADPSNNITLDYTISGGNENGTTGTLTFLAGTTILSQTVSVTTAGDVIIEEDENITVTLSNPSANVTISATDNIGESSFTNDDTSVISINNPIAIPEGDSGVANLSFIISIDQADPVNNITVNYTVSGGNEDGTTGTLTFLAATTTLSQTIAVTTPGDLLIESDELIMVTLNSSSVNAEISTTNGIGQSSFQDDDSCAVGTADPVLNMPLGTVFCDVISQDLDEYVLNSPPVNAELRWSTNSNPLIISAHLTNTIVSSVDTYYGFFFDSINECASTILSVELNVNISPNPGTVTNRSTCSFSSDGVSIVDLDDQITGADPGNWTLVSAPAGALATPNSNNIINFDGQPEGDYIYEYETNGAQSPCVNDVTSPPLTITVIDCSIPCDAGTTAPPLNTAIPTTFCDVITSSLDDYISDDVVVPAGSVLVWNLDNESLLDVNSHLNAVQTSNPPSAGGSFYAFFFDEVNGCASPFIEVELQINPTPVITSVTNDEICGVGELTLAVEGNIPDVVQPPTFNWYDAPVGGNLVFTGATFITNLSVTTSFYVEAIADGCASEREEVIATVNIQPIDGLEINSSSCSDITGGSTDINLDTILLSEDDGTLTYISNFEGVWSVAADPSGVIVIDVDNVVNFEGLEDGEYIFTYTTTNADALCVNASANVIVSVDSCLIDTDNDGLTDGMELNLGTEPDNPDTDGDGISDGDEFANETNPLDSCDPILSPDCNPEPIDLQIEKTVDNNSSSIGEQVVFTITLTNLSSDRIINVEVSEIINNDVFRYVSDTPSKGTYDLNLGIWQLDQIDEDEVNTLEITVEVLNEGSHINEVSILTSFPIDDNDANDNASVIVTVNDGDCGLVFNQFSPNQDGINDLLIINCINQYPNNTLEIYNRYGSKVFDAKPYDNTWDGTRKNAELPLGTYFYILNLGDNSEVRKGWIQIIR